ncbi:hypothetical protein LTR37_017842 [Vermiconidia calcicola]|uniref:Uncharacterized protein n=1 Tax=Vermiconidia calcicola TaxID=1690605 RepID=A0ACC3MJ13_9PEZI|nr:hypothetical protein LTR37_017842 [Vermiconidia calcicola]
MVYPEMIFQKARRSAPCLLILADLDSLVGDDTRSYFLNEVDGLESNDGLLIIGSTNHLDRLDPAVTKRPSRFDRKYHFKLPNEDERLAYCRYWRHKLTSPNGFMFPDEICPIVARWTDGYSFAYLNEHADEQSEDQGASSNDENAERTNSMNGKAERTNPSGEKAERTIPAVEIPESLQHNALLHTVKMQAQSLLEERNHEASTGNNKLIAPQPPVQYRIAAPLDEGEEDY